MKGGRGRRVRGVVGGRGGRCGRITSCSSRAAPSGSGGFPPALLAREDLRSRGVGGGFVVSQTVTAGRDAGKSRGGRCGRLLSRRFRGVANGHGGFGTRERVVGDSLDASRHGGFPPALLAKEDLRSSLLCDFAPLRSLDTIHPSGWNTVGSALSVTIGAA